MIKIAFDPDRTPREQIEVAIASVAPCTCKSHPHEILHVDRAASFRSALRRNPPDEDEPHRARFSATYERCSVCPHNNANRDIEVKGCPVFVARFGRIDHSSRDSKGRLRPQCLDHAILEPEICLSHQYGAWLARTEKIRCARSNQVLDRCDVQMTLPFSTWNIVPQFSPCPQCGLEDLGILPDEAYASFENFTVDPPSILSHLEACREFASTPRGVLMLLGNCGTGKTHLAIAILREFLNRDESDLRFIKHRHFLAEHRHSLRPVAFGEQPAKSPLRRCQRAALLVYDELTAATGSSSGEDVLLDLFEYRIGNFKPTIITANVSRGELETTFGTRLYDRLRRATFAVLEFGFESKRPSLTTHYLNRVFAAGA